MVLFLLILIVNSFVLVGCGKYLHRMDSFTADKKNENRLFWLIISGGIPSIIITLIIHPIWDSTLYNLTGLYYGENTFISQFLVIGPVEEFSKFIVFIFLTSSRKSIKEPRDGMLQAASVALGFALTENIFYAMSGGIILLLIRSIITIIAHMTYAVIWGFAWGSLGYSNSSKTHTSGWYYVIPALILAALFHGATNFFLLTGYPLLALFIDGLAIVLFINIYKIVRENSPYRKYKLEEYRTAIPSIKVGLQKYPDSYFLNIKLGIFYIYARKYKVGEKYLLKARKLRLNNAESKFYCGVAIYLDGRTSEGIRVMNRAIKAISEEKILKMVANLKKVISVEAERAELLSRFNKNRMQFIADAPTPYKRRSRRNNSKGYTSASRSLNRRSSVYKKDTKSNLDVNKPLLNKTTKEKNRFGKKIKKQIRHKDSLDNRGLWESMFKDNPDPIILEPYYLKKGESVITSIGKLKRK
jgi:protease PrsW